MPDTAPAEEPAEEPELTEEKYDEEEEDIRPELTIAPKDRKLVTHPYDFIIRSLQDQIEDKTLLLADNFQRRRVWDDSKSSRLIESLLLNVPIPVCYFAELEAGSYTVLDGQQRLTAIYRFLKNEFPLRGLRVRPELNKKRFHELADIDRKMIASRTIRCIVVLKESHPDIRFDIFERLNTGAVRLNAQELRNSMFRGKLNDLIRELSEYAPFMKARGAKGLDKRMQDCELILRFFAFHFRLGTYSGYYSSFLDDYLKEGQSFDAPTIDLHRQMFKRLIDDSLSIFGDHTFRRAYGKHWERLPNRAVYDVIMLSFAQLDSATIRAKATELDQAFLAVNEDPEFGASITFSTKDKKRLQTRLDKWQQAQVGIGLAVPAFKVGK